ncbi:XRE family transcriptional regulator [Bacillus canaveralius]|uniref:XRE family transcriptional regulator n=1 Tax=Bacillus canaveralius TaxID=1403243 RepID=A0A2N5GHK5_9BACI|nr:MULTISPECIES: helix-turn-helix transcriptional regulator [Bacillus]PLR78911.1 XRE family transcriptional regulator [Bacillus sp. V3-13]PLR80228.1 XRE family transcriptional regulator [Bacillus canaveralius]PLR83201.1 XRE family transcriptional regulator [Bacillus sp. V33-4]PLS00453.1 XRE family transcriptional regulator [Bacillus canaveralius]RSK56890.1 XRE family transcriptional regulator [Bacillus canaveralius]
MEAEKWGRRIRAFRKLKGFTQDGFAKGLGVSVSILGEIERGNRMPTEEFLHRAAHLLNINREELTPPEDHDREDQS